MRLSKEEVQSIAMLARIGLTDEEVERAERELGAVLGYVERLQGIETIGVPEAAAVPIKAFQFREDVATAPDEAERARIFNNFPAQEGRMLKAPAVFERPKR